MTYPPLPEHEQIRKPFQWPKALEFGPDDRKEFRVRHERKGGRPKKDEVPLYKKILAYLKRKEWATCIELGIGVGYGKKSVQNAVCKLLEEKRLIRRRRSWREYEYSLAKDEMKVMK